MEQLETLLILYWTLYKHVRLGFLMSSFQTKSQLIKQIQATIGHSWFNTQLLEKAW